MMLGGVVPYRIHHLGVRVPNDRVAERVKRRFGLETAWVNDLDEHECRCHFCPGPGLALELVVPLRATSSTAAIPDGLHHLGLEVPDLAVAQTRLEDEGFEFTDRAPLPIVGRYLVNFLRPLRLGFVVELVEDRESGWPG
jgi:catechol 2,3-dioxygenase-like lactoylglutathione lyase family enzyme